MKNRPTQPLYAMLSFAFILLMGVGHLTAQVPQLLDYDGYLIENKKPANGVRTMEVRVHDAAVKGKLLYSEKIGNVSVAGGEFYFQYGSKGIATALQGTSHWLEIVVNNKPQSPRERLISVPFALRSGDAQTLVPQVSSLAGTVSTIQSQNTALSSNLTTAKAAIATLTGNITTIKSQNTALSSNLTTAQDTINLLTKELQALREELEAAGVLSGGGGNATADMVSVAGGTLPEGSELGGQVVAAFQIGKYEVTWGEWKEVREWAVANGYNDLAGVGAGNGDNFPVAFVSWYDVVKWSNARSEKEGLTPVYEVSGATYKTGEVAPTLNASANGYRLPSEKEWEWAARGGVSSQGYSYSGSNTVNDVAWTYENSSDGTKAVGTKLANELGIYDMSGNVWEWSEDVAYTSNRRIRGGSWDYDDDFAAVAYRAYVIGYPGSRYDRVGFRLARSSGN
jgi:sulfatase modifying factor 1